MKAIMCTKSGPPDVLELREVEKPVPRHDEVLIKVRATTVTSGDVMLRKLHPWLYLPMRLFGVRRKLTPGHEFAGEIVTAGKGVKHFKVGDRVYGTTTGLDAGANAEFVCVPEAWSSGVLAIIPDNTSFLEAAALPVGGMTALYILRKGNIQRGQKVLVYGASGSVGTYAVQLARNYFGAEVTGVCSTANIDLVKSLGAAEVIDYTKVDLTQTGSIYDIIFDAVGKLSTAQSKKLLKENGTHLSIQTTTRENPTNLKILSELVAAGKLKAVIDRRYSLEQVAEAHQYVETGRKRGNVVISVVASGQF